MNPYRFVSCLAVLVAFSSEAFALQPEIVDRGERATAVVQLVHPVAGRQVECAFCVSKSGIFVTTGRVPLETGERLQIVLWPGGANQRAFDARVLRRDEEQNIAILQASSPEKFDALDLASDKLFNTMDIAAFGYPSRGPFMQNGVEQPPISVNVGHVTSLLDKDGELDRIYIDAAVSRGMTGGPVLDDHGNVVGMIGSDVYPGRQAYAIPASRIRKLLLDPQISLKTPTLSYEKRHEEQDLTLEVRSLMEPVPDYDVEFTIREGDRPARTLAARAGDGVVNFRFVPVESHNENALPIVAKFKKGLVKGIAENTLFQIGDHSLKLDAIKELRHPDGSDWEATTLDGQKLTGKLTGLDAVMVDLGPASAKIDLSQACCVAVDATQGLVRSLGYSLTVKVNGQVVGQTAGTIDLAGAPAAPAGGDSLSGAGPKIDISTDRLVPEGHAIHTVLLGGPGGNPIDIRSPVPRDVIGFTYHMSVWAMRPILQNFVPIYDRPIAAQPDTVIAKEGYVVGGILVDSDLYTHAVRVIFMRLENGRLDPKDNYLSDWIGQPVSGQLPKQLAGHGEHVIGVCGRKGLNMDAIGLVIQP